jgi:ribosomal protein L12E/L44/L45/RPP1/RPP2
MPFFGPMDNHAKRNRPRTNITLSKTTKRAGELVATLRGISLSQLIEDLLNKEIIRSGAKAGAAASAELQKQIEKLTEEDEQQHKAR